MAPSAPDKLADRYSLHLWGREQDFPDTRIRALDFDSEGRLWFATPKSLARFDGVTLNMVTNLPPGIMPVRGWLQDAEGAPWVYGVGGVARLGRAGWQNVVLPTGGPIRTQAVFTNAAGGLWMVGEKALWCFQGGKLTCVVWPTGLSEPIRITSAALDGEHTLWLAVSGQLLAYRDAHWLTAEEAGVARWNSVTLVHAEEHGTLLVAEQKGLYVRHQGQWTKIPLPPPGSGPDVAELQPTALLEESSSGNIWLGTRHALYRWSRGLWLSLTDIDIGAPLAVNVLDQDRYSDIWVGLESGLLSLHRRSVTMLHTTEVSRQEPVTTVVAINDSQVWVGVKERGLWSVTRNKLEPLSLPLPGNTTVSAVLPAEGGWWVGTRGDGLFWMTTNQLKSAVVATTNVAAPRNIIAMQRARDGRLWVGTWEGLFWLPDVAPAAGQSPVLQSMTPPMQGAADGQGRGVVALAADGEGALWVAYAGQGLARVETNGILRSFGPSDGLPETAPLCLHTDREGRLWAGCARGLIRWDGHRWQACDVRKDLVVRHLYNDNKGRLWLGTAQGLQCLRPDAVKDALAHRPVSGRYFHIGAADGLPASECVAQSGQAVAANQSDLFFATPDGVARISINIAQTGRKPQAMDIETVSAAGQMLWNRRARAPGEPLPPARRLKLAPGSQPITFEFAMPELFWPERIRYDYQWKLEGLNEAWSPATTESHVTFDYVPPGDYSFRVRGRREGDWSEAVQPVMLRVLPFFWQRTWFHVVVSVCALALTALTAWQLKRGWYKRRLRRAEQAQALAQERTRIAQDLHDEMGAGLTEISLLGDLAAADKHEAERAENISLLTQRARALVDKLDEIVWAVNPRHDHLEALSDFFCNHAQHFLRAAGIACELDIAAALPALPLEARTRHQLFLAFTEALNNLVRHSGATRVRLRIAVEAGELRISVGDNGHGLTPATGAGVPDGLHSMRSRLEKLGGICDIQSSAGGVTVLLRLPLPAGRCA
ncbi:MAG: triple tyrosine motif-containing protein [Kiritimatiellaeota bacterium]|nr:triple tyrosine motif-containing protein [Kiritimatiellota bacterium]